MVDLQLPDAVPDIPADGGQELLDRHGGDHHLLLPKSLQPEDQRFFLAIGFEPRAGAIVAFEQRVVRLGLDLAGYEVSEQPRAAVRPVLVPRHVEAAECTVGGAHEVRGRLLASGDLIEYVHEAYTSVLVGLGRLDRLIILSHL
jgi:hypothetical protein